MKKLNPWIVLTLLLTMTISSLQSQENNENDADYSSAYQESSHTAHWSIYIPISILVAAAIYFGIADQNDSRSDYYDSQDALGSIGNSKRINGYSRRSGHYRNSTTSKSNSRHSHS